MKKSSLQWVAPLFFILLGVGCSSTPKTPVAPAVSVSDEKPWAKPYYFKAMPFSVEEGLAPPPADGSAVDQKDFKELFKLQKSRTQAQCDAAALQQVPTFENVFQEKALHKVLARLQVKHPDAYEKLKTFFAHTERDVMYVFEAEKKQWKRSRPFVRNAELHPCIRKETSFSYPSGHAGFAATGEEILAEFYPSRTLALKKAEKQAGKNRILGGVHHPSDVEAGYSLAHKVLAVLKKNPQFEADFAEVKTAIHQH